MANTGIKQSTNNQGEQMRIDEKDLRAIKSLYADNDAALKMLRKIFLPEISPEAPIGQQIDLWMTIPVDNMMPEQAMVNLKARNTLISHIEMCLGQLKTLAGRKEESVEETKERLLRNSSK